MYRLRYTLLLAFFIISLFPKAEAQIFFADQVLDEISKVNLDGSGFGTFLSNPEVSAPQAVFVDILNSKIYWSEQQALTIKRANSDGTSPEIAVNVGAEVPSLAVDAVNSKIYWVNKDVRKLQRADLDGSNIEDLFTGLDPIAHLALDVENGKIYFMMGSDSVSIYRVDLAGGSAEEVVNSNLSSGANGLTIDTVNDKLYWTSNSFQEIRRSNLDGTVPEKVADITESTSRAEFITLDVANGHVYWSEQMGFGQGIQRVNFDGSNKTLVVAASNPFGLGLLLGCSSSLPDSDGDGTADCSDSCPADAGKLTAGVCGCGVADSDSDSDGTFDCNDACPDDSNKIAPGVCGCGLFDIVKPSGTSCATAPLLTPDTVLEEGPDVEVTGRSIKVTMQPFSGASLQNQSQSALAQLTAQARKKLKVQYKTVVRNAEGKKKAVAQRVSKRNEVTFKNMKAGNYNVRYRARITRNQKVVSRTNPSPPSSASVSRRR